MPEIINKNIGLAFDMIGCPNFCRHCWLGRSSNIKLTEHDVRWGVNEFKEYFHKSSDPIENISVTTWFREPDYSDNYRQLFELEAELSDTEPKRYELLSIWRLANDPTYAEWAKSVGPSTCQISFFLVWKTRLIGFIVVKVHLGPLCRPLKDLFKLELNLAGKYFLQQSYSQRLMTLLS
jgi:hypothetical protein